jgi:hypothetical protein
VESHGRATDRLVVERVRAALPADAFHLYPNADPSSHPVRCRCLTPQPCRRKRLIKVVDIERIRSRLRRRALDCTSCRGAHGARH